MKLRLPPATPFIVTVILLLLIVYIQAVGIKQGLEIKTAQKDIVTALQPKEDEIVVPATESAEVEPTPSPVVKKVTPAKPVATPGE